MAWLGGDSFDFYTASQTDWTNSQAGDSPWSNFNATTVTNTTPFGVGASMSSAAVGQNAISNAFTASATIFVNFQFYNAQAFTPGGTTVYGGVQFRDGATVQCGVFIRSGGDVIVTNGNGNGTILATSAQIFPTGTGNWNHVQMKVTINNTTGSVAVRMNGNASDDFNSGSINTRQGTANNQATAIVIGCLTGCANSPQNWDDVYWFNDQGAVPNAYQGVVRGYTYYPTSDTSVQWTPNSGGNNFSRVGSAFDGDTSYNSDSTAGHVDKYGLPALPNTPTTIVAVQTRMCARFDDAGPHSASSRLWSGVTTSDSVTAALSSSYNQLWKTYTTDPATSAAWAASTLSTLSLGIVDVS
jgi:hypothetical protein